MPRSVEISVSPENSPIVMEEEDDDVFGNDSQQDDLLIRKPRRNVAVLGTFDGLIAVAVLHSMFIFPTLVSEILKDSDGSTARHDHLYNVIIPYYILVPTTIAFAFLFRFQAYRQTVCTTWSFLKEVEVKESRSLIMDLLTMSDVDFMEREGEEDRIRLGSLPVVLPVFRIFLLELVAACGLLIGSITAAIFAWFYYHYPRLSEEQEDGIFDTHINFVGMQNVKNFLMLTCIIAVMWIVIAWRLKNFASCKSSFRLRKIIQWFLLSVPLQFAFYLAAHVSVDLDNLQNPRPVLTCIVLFMWIFGICARTTGVIVAFRIVQRLCHLRRAPEERSVWSAMLRHGFCVWREWWVL